MKTITRMLVIFLIVFGSTISTGSAAPMSRTIPVNTHVDELLENGFCSLREAVFSANNQTSSYGCSIVGTLDEITILVPDGDYYLTRSGVVEDLISEFDDLDIVTSMTITGAGPEETKIDGSGLSRIFDIQAGDIATITISELTIRNGDSGISAGGGIRNHSNLILENVIVTGNHSGDYGGGIFHKSEAGVPGSPPLNKISAPDAPLAVAQLTLINSTVSYNDATLYGGGIANTVGSGMQIEDSIISFNTSDSDLNSTGDGGGIYNQSDQPFRMMRSQVIGNSAGNAWGGGYAEEGVDNSYITDTLFYDNEATFRAGGNIYHPGTGLLDMIRVTIEFGTALTGGGLAATGGVTGLQNATVAYNTASGPSMGGGIYIAGEDTELVISFSTIAENQATTGAGIYHINDGPLTVQNTIIAQNWASTAVLGNCSGSVTSFGFNLSDGYSCSLGITGDLPGTPAGFDQYGLNHAHYSYLRTFALSAESEAIDGADPDSMIAEDERSFPRGVDGDGDGLRWNDIGAYELQLMFYLPILMK
jgi:CSLREA domain-containing protein